MTIELTIILLKWVAQALIVVVGVWGLLSNPYEEDPGTGRRRLTRAGWIKVGLLAIGFLLFVLTDIDERRSSAARRDLQAQQLTMQLATVESQAKQLGYLQRLLLLQYRLSEITLTLDFPEEIINAMREAIRNYKTDPSESKPDPTRLAYIATATHQGTVIVRYSGAGRGELQYTLNRPLGLTSGRISNPDPEWKAFDNAFRMLLGERFEILSDPGRTLIDVLNPESNMAVTFGKNTVTIDLRNPGIRLDELNGAVKFVCGQDAILYVIEGIMDEDEQKRTKTPKPMHFGPRSIRFSSKDPRVNWNQEVHFTWRPEVIRSFDEADGERTYELGEWHSGPNTIKANYAVFESDLPKRAP